MHRRRGSLVAAAIGVAAAAAILLLWSESAEAGGTPPPPTDPTCGEVLWRDIVLTHDLHCAGDGLIVEKPSDATRDAIVIDLNGHTLWGDGTGTGIGGDVTGYLAGETVVVRNGTVRGFANGIRFSSLFPCLEVPCGGGASHVSLLGNGVGLFLVSPPELHDVRMRGNQRAGQLGGYGAPGQGPPFERLKVIDNAGGLTLTSLGSWYPPITDSAINGNQGCGLAAGFNDAHVVRTWFVNNDCGASVDTSLMTIEDSVFWGNRAGITQGDAVPANYVVRRSSFVLNDVGVVLPRLFQGESTFEANRFWHNDQGMQGVVEGNLAARSTLRVTGNDFFWNGRAPDAGMPPGSGLQVAAGPQVDLVITHNRLYQNGGLGADVAGTVIDDAGNLARNNGDPAQCVGIVCTAP